MLRHLEVRGQLLILVDVHFHQLPFAGGFGFELFKHRAKRLAGAAPGRPEIDQYGGQCRRRDDVLFECGQSGVHCVLVDKTDSVLDKGAKAPDFNAAIQLGQRNPFGFAGHLAHVLLRPRPFRGLDLLARTGDEIPVDKALPVQLLSADQHHARAMRPGLRHGFVCASTAI